MKKIYLVLILAFSALASFAQVTFVHNSPDTSLSKVALWLDDVNIKDTLQFREFFTYSFSNPDTVDVILKDLLGNEITRISDFILDPSKSLHVYVNGLTDPAKYVANPSGFSTGLSVTVKDVSDTVPEGLARVIFVHGGTDLPTLDITKFPGALIVDQLAYGTVADTNLPAVANNINLLTADSSLALGSFVLNLSDQSTKTVVVLLSGFLSPTQNNNGEVFNVFNFKNGGLSVMTNVTPVVNRTSSLALKIYPNPSKGETFLQADIQQSGNYTVRIMNLSGAEMMAVPIQFLSAGKQQIPLSLQNLPSGTYVLHLQGQQYSGALKMVIVQ